MNTKSTCKILAVAGATILLITVGVLSTANANAQLNTPPNTGLASPGYLIINNAIVQSAGLNAILRTNGVIPTDGSGGAFGYGIVTSAGLSAVIVATTHQGVRDSVTQGSGAGPIWHNAISHPIRSMRWQPAGNCHNIPTTRKSACFW